MWFFSFFDDSHVDGVKLILLPYKNTDITTKHAPIQNNPLNSELNK